MPPPGSVARPPTVNAGFGMWLGGLMLVWVIPWFILLFTDPPRGSQNPAADAAWPSETVVATALVALIIVGSCVPVLTLLVVMLRGHRWARNLLTAGGIVMVVCVMALWGGTPSPTQHGSLATNAIFLASGTPGSLLILGGIYVLHRKDAEVFFRHRREVKAALLAGN
jgi:hypothetical protein